MNGSICPDQPELFRRLGELGCLNGNEIAATEDGFCAVTESMSNLLLRRGIKTVPGSRGSELECKLFFDDWYLCAVSDGAAVTYSLFKMREQEFDAKMGVYADGDAPGVTVCFIAMQTQVLLDCLTDASAQNRKRLGDEINRVVASGGQTHSEALKAYYIRPEAQAPYLIARLYTDYIGSMAVGGTLQVPERYASDYEKSGLQGRIAQFIEENNSSAGTVVCDHGKITVQDPASLTKWERLAILATHTGNVSVHSFAAEVRFHAAFLTSLAKLPLPIIGRSAYASAIRADMSIADAEFTGPTPYYRLNSKLVRDQHRCHGDAPAYWAR